MTDDCRRWREQLGSLALGHLEPEARVALQAHIDDCDPCRDEADALESVAGLLPRVDPKRLSHEPAPSASLADRVSRRVAEAHRGELEQRRRARVKRSAAALVAAAVVALGVGLAVLLPGSGTERVTFGVAPVGVEAAASVRARPWGTQVDLEINRLAPGEVYSVWLQRTGGDRVAAGTFEAIPGRRVIVTLASALPRSQSVALGVSDERGQTILLAMLPTPDDSETS